MIEKRREFYNLSRWMDKCQNFLETLELDEDIIFPVADQTIEFKPYFGYDSYIIRYSISGECEAFNYFRGNNGYEGWEAFTYGEHPKYVIEPIFKALHFADCLSDEFYEAFTLLRKDMEKQMAEKVREKAKRNYDYAIDTVEAFLES